MFARSKLLVGSTILCITSALGIATLRAEDQPALTLIDNGLNDLSGSDVNRLQQLRDLATAVTQGQPNNVLVREVLDAAMQSTAETDAQKAADLKVALTKVKAILGFKPLREAKLPKGFPEPTPVGELRVKEYPAYRLARTETRRGRNGAFGILFNHIKQNKIAMTAPVEMTYEASTEGELDEAAMAFLYRSTDLGQLQQGERVVVTDIPPMTTISIGVRGEYDNASLATARKHLEEWLENNKSDYVAAGALRMMGYNSPMVPTFLRYAEVEIPIERVE